MPKTLDSTRYVKKWNEEDLQKAIGDIHSGLPVRAVCRKYPNIPRSTLQFRSSNKFIKSSFGPSPILNITEEKELVDWVIDCQKKGFPRRREDIQASVKQFLDENPRKNPFTNNYPGDGWYKAFLKRHPELTERKSEAITSASSKISESDIRQWFLDINSYLKVKGFDNILNFPERIFNGDETNFQLCPQNKKVLAPKGSKNVYEIDGGQAKTSLTVLFCFSASGVSTPPLIIYPYKRLPKDIAESVKLEGFQAACSDTGWMKTEIFYEYIGNVFYPFIKNQGITFPILLFVDGHKTHLDRKLSSLCSELGIILVALYPNATRILQPADVSTFKPLKDGWRKGVLDWRRNHPLEELTKKAFASLLSCVISTSLRPQIIISGFKACGLYPWNPSAIKFDKCLGKDKLPQKFNESKTLNTLNFTDFAKIVGENRLHKFENYDSELENEDLNIIYKLWMTYQEKPSGEESKGEDIIMEIIDIKDNEETVVIHDFDSVHESNLEYKATEFDIVQTTDSVTENQSPRVINSYLTLSDIASLPILIEADGIIKEISSEIPISVEEPVQFNSGSATAEEISLGSPNASIHLNNSTIGEYLFYYGTPERKGTKNTEKMPYIITSTPWKEIKDKKEADKQKKIEEKQNRKTEREAKKAKKEEELAQKKAKRKQKSIINKSKKAKKTEFPSKKTENKNPINSNIEGTESRKINLVSNIILEPLKPQNRNENEIITGDNHLPELKETTKQFSERLAKITRQVFQPEEEDFEINTRFSFKNSVLYTGLCFVCTRNINKNTYGIKCYLCLRTFHLICIEKHNLHKSNSEIFTCLTCLKKAG